MPNLWNATVAGHLGRDAESKTVNDQTVSEGGVQAHQSQALMTGGTVDV